MTHPKKWQQDKDFVTWLHEVEYVRHDARGKLCSNVQTLSLIYMWESWCAALDKKEGTS